MKRNVRTCVSQQVRRSLIIDGFRGITNAKEQEFDQLKKVAQQKSETKRRKTIIVIEPPDSSKGTLSVNPSARYDGNMSHIEGSINNEQIRDNNPSVAQFENRDDLDDEEVKVELESPREQTSKEKRQIITEALEDIQVELNIDTGFESTINRNNSIEVSNCDADNRVEELVLTP